MGFVLALLATCLHTVLCFAVAPLVQGVVDKMRARLLGRRGPPLLQPYWSLLKLLRKATLVPDTATFFFTLWPLLMVLALAVALMLVPGFCTGLLTASASGYVTLIGLLALARVAWLLAGLENGSALAGAQVGRALVRGVFAEAILLVLLLVFAGLTYGVSLNRIAVGGQSPPARFAVALVFGLPSMLMLALSVRTHDEAMLLEYSGRLRALWAYGGMLRLLVWINLLGCCFWPFGMARASAILSWPVGLLVWAVKLLLLAAMLGGFEALRRQEGLVRLPAFLSLTLALAVLGALFVGGGYPSLLVVLGGLVLLCMFLQLYQRRVAVMIGFNQGAALALAVMAWYRAVGTHQPIFYGAALVILGVAGVVTPVFLRKRAAQSGGGRGPLLPVPLTMALGVLLVGVALLVVPVAFQVLALALAVVLLAVLLMLVWDERPVLWLALAGLVNGVVLAVLAMPHPPVMGAGVVVLLGVPLVVMWVARRWR